MARCQLAIAVLCMLQLCYSHYNYGGFQDRLIPQPLPMYNPYTRYGYAPSIGPRYPQPAYFPNLDVPVEEDPSAFLQEEVEAASTGGTLPTTTGTTPAATSTAPSSDSASVQTPAQTQGSETGATTGGNSNMDALDIQLAAALEAVKADMISKGKEILEEKQWTDDVKSVIQQYQHKISNVYINIESLKTDMGTLYKKKQQIINAQLQKSLNSKLQDSKNDLATVTSALERVENTQAEFAQSKSDIEDTINQIYAQLAELKGQAASGGASGAAAGGASGATNSNSNSQSGSDSNSSSDPSSDPSSSDPSSDSSSDSTDYVSDQDIVDKSADINSKIDAIKSIVGALGGTGSSL